MQVKVYLHGHLRSKIQKEYIEVEALTVYEALKVLAFKYEKILKAPLDIGRWKVRVKDYDTKESWYVPIYTKELHIYPVFKTAKSQWVTVAIGVAMVAAAIWLGPASFAVMGLGGAGTLGAATAGFLFTTGLGIALSGIINLFCPQPKLNTSIEASNNSKYLGAQGNTVSAGTRIPFGYGLFKISGHFISYNVSSTVVKTI